MDYLLPKSDMVGTFEIVLTQPYLLMLQFWVYDVDNSQANVTNSLSDR